MIIKSISDKGGNKFSTKLSQRNNSHGKKFKEQSLKRVSSSLKKDSKEPKRDHIIPSKRGKGKIDENIGIDPEEEALFMETLKMHSNSPSGWRLVSFNNILIVNLTRKFN